MRTSVFSTRALIARALTAGLFAAVALFGLSGSPAWSQTPKDIRWGTGPVGSVGHKALVVLADLLNKEMPEYRITVLPMPGAVMTVKGFATEQIDAYLRLRRRAARIRQRHRPLQGLQGDAEAPAGAVDVDLHARHRPRDQGEQRATRSRSGAI